MRRLLSDRLEAAARSQLAAKVDDASARRGGATRRQRRHPHGRDAGGAWYAVRCVRAHVSNTDRAAEELTELVLNGVLDSEAGICRAREGVPKIVRDIRELTGDPEAYAASRTPQALGRAAELPLHRPFSRPRWTPARSTTPPTLRHDMRNPTGGLPLAVLGIASHRTAAAYRIWRPCRTRSSTPCQILDPGRDVRRIEINTEVPQAGTADGLQPLDHRRCRQTEPGPGIDRRAWASARRAARKAAEDGNPVPPRMVDT